MIVLAGDIGGTNTRLALFEDAKGEPLVAKTFPSASFQSFDDIAERFLIEAAPQLGKTARAPFDWVAKACAGIAGPVDHGICRATNLPWVVDESRLQERLGVSRFALVNDFYAAALGITVVSAEHMVAFGGAPRDPTAPMAVLGAGTGLGEAFLIWSAAENQYKVVSSEGGHVEFAPRTPLEIGLLQYLMATHARVSNERVLSGPGLVNVYKFLSQEPSFATLIRPETTAAMATEDPAAVISRRGSDGSDPVCEMALSVFCSVLGSVAGNLGLSVLATGGVYVAGGIAPRIVDYLKRSAFRESFERKGRLRPVVAQMPAFVVTHPHVGVLGAAAAAMRLV